VGGCNIPPELRGQVTGSRHGSSAHDQHPRPAGHLSRGRGSHRATNLMAGYGLTSAPGPTGVSVCCCLRPVV